MSLIMGSGLPDLEREESKSRKEKRGNTKS